MDNNITEKLNKSELKTLADIAIREAGSCSFCKHELTSLLKEPCSRCMDMDNDGNFELKDLEKQ